MKLEGENKEKLLGHKKTLKAIIFTVLAIMSIYLIYMGYVLLSPEKTFNPALTIGLFVMLIGTLPAYIQLSKIERELKK
jgi:hypothetical protein